MNLTFIIRSINIRNHLPLIILLLTTSTCTQLYGRNKKLDSLLIMYNKASQDTVRCRLMLSLGEENEYQLPDTAIMWYQKVFTTANNSKCPDEILLFYAAYALYNLSWMEKLLNMPTDQ